MGFVFQQLENQQCTGTIFESGKARGMGSTFHLLCPRRSEPLTPTAPTAIKLWETFTILIEKEGKRENEIADNPESVHIPAGI